MNFYGKDISHVGLMKSKKVGEDIEVLSDKYLHEDEQDFYSSTRTARLEFLAKRKPAVINRYGSATFMKTEPYSPLIPWNAYYVLQINEPERISKDITIFYHSPLKAFKASIAGVYTINVLWRMEIPDPQLMNFVEIHLFKNGQPYKMLDRQPMKSVIPLQAPAMHLEMCLTGSKDIDLKPEDYFDIRLMHDKQAGFGVAEEHTGYIDIDFEHNWRIQ